MDWFRVLEGHVLTKLELVPSGSVRCCVTSPPYFRQRRYGVPDEIGWEDSVDEYCARLVEIFAEVHRVLSDDGTLWVNIGDKFNGSGGAGGDYVGGGIRDGQRRYKACRLPEAKPKDLLMVPAKLAIALRDWGWYLRSDNIWNKTNTQPTGVADRPLIFHEYVFQFSKSRRYFYDQDAVREITGREASWEEWRAYKGRNKGADADRFGKGYRKRSPAITHPLGRGLRSVWKISGNTSNGKKRKHFSSFPTGLPRIPILAGSAPGDVVLDCFSGSGSTGVEALRLDRRYLGIEPDAKHAASSRERLSDGWLEDLL